MWVVLLIQIESQLCDVSDGVTAFASKNEMFQEQPAPAVMIAYMNAQCGLLVFKPVSGDGWTHYPGLKKD